MRLSEVDRVRHPLLALLVQSLPSKQAEVYDGCVLVFEDA